MAIKCLLARVCSLSSYCLCALSIFCSHELPRSICQGTCKGMVDGPGCRISGRCRSWPSRVPSPLGVGSASSGNGRGNACAQELAAGDIREPTFCRGALPVPLCCRRVPKVAWLRGSDSGLSLMTLDRSSHWAPGARNNSVLPCPKVFFWG